MFSMKPATISLSASAAVLLACLPANALEAADGDTAATRHYAIYRADGKIEVDGRFDEPAWFAAPAMGAFHFPWFKGGEKEQTVVKMLWDDENLYIAHICQDANIKAQHEKHDDPVPEDDCLEVMLAPRFERPTDYYNIEWNVLGGYVDGHRPEGPQGPRPTWDVQGLRVAGAVAGEANDEGERDSHWQCEVAIPLANFTAAPPKDGDRWRLNFNRHGGAVNMQYSQWSPGQGPQPAFHQPDRFGQVTFTSATALDATSEPGRN